MKVRDHVNMSVTVSIAVFHSSDKLFEENTVRNIKEKYSGLCVGDKSLASQYQRRIVLKCSCYGMFLLTLLAYSFLF